MPPSGDVKCLLCNCDINDLFFKSGFYQEDYPDIEIGPYCERCMGKIKICSGCQRPVEKSKTKATPSGDIFCPDCYTKFII